MSTALSPTSFVILFNFFIILPIICLSLLLQIFFKTHIYLLIRKNKNKLNQSEKDFITEIWKRNAMRFILFILIITLFWLTMALVIVRSYGLYTSEFKVHPLRFIAIILFSSVIILGFLMALTDLNSIDRIKKNSKKNTKVEINKINSRLMMDNIISATTASLCMVSLIPIPICFIILP